MYSKQYLKFAKKVDSIPYTRSQRCFAEYILTIKKEISVMGNMEQVFIDVRKYLRK